MALATTILFIPGAWHPASCWSKVADRIKSFEYNTRLLDLPSNGPEVFTDNFDRDVAAIRDELSSLVNAGQNVVVAAHSYGSIPVSQAVQGFDSAGRADRKLRGGVTKLFFCCAFLIDVGTSLHMAIGGQDAPWMDVSEDQMRSTVKTPIDAFYNDLPTEDAEAAAKMLLTLNYKSFHSKLDFAGWKVIPTTYLFCMKDHAIPFNAQHHMVEEAQKTHEIRTETFDTSHSPFLLKPDETAAVIRRVIES